MHSQGKIGCSWLYQLVCSLAALVMHCQFQGVSHDGSLSLSKNIHVTYEKASVLMCNRHADAVALQQSWHINTPNMQSTVTSSALHSPAVRV
jgi:hypothetical protein